MKSVVQLVQRKPIVLHIAGEGEGKNNADRLHHLHHLEAVR